MRQRLASAARDIGSGSPAAGNPDGATGACPASRHPRPRRAATPPTAPTLEQFLSGLRTAWQEGEVRPTSTPKPKAKRLRRRPDPFAAVTLVAAGMVRGRTVAHIARTARAAAGRVSRHVSEPAAANMPAPSKGMAARGRPPVGLRDHAGGRHQLGQHERMRGTDRRA